MKDALWKIEPMSRPSEAHAADAVEIVNGEPVRRVTLPQLDYDVYLAYEAGRGKDARALAHALSLPVEAVSLALQRLAAAGLVTPDSEPSLQ